MAYKRLFPSKRGRKREGIYDSLFQEREREKAMQVFPGMFDECERKTSVSSYTELASRVAGRPVSAKTPDEDPARQRFIRAYQRRRKALRIPDPPQD